MRLILSSIVLLLIFFTAGPVWAQTDELTDKTDELVREKFFRKPQAILWTYQGEGSRSYVLQVRHGFVSDDILPNVFGELGIIPDAIVGNIIYESNPTGEEGDTIWSEVTAFYDKLFDYEWLEGRAIYRDILLDSYLGVGLGFVPVHNSWVGGYYLGNDGFKLSAEAAKAFGEDWWIYGNIDYYTDSEWVEGELGLVFRDTIHIAVINRLDTWIYSAGIEQSL